MSSICVRCPEIPWRPGVMFLWPSRWFLTNSLSGGLKAAGPSILIFTRALGSWLQLWSEVPFKWSSSFVAGSHLSFESDNGLSFPATPEAASEVFLRLRPTHLLAYQKFLLCQPASEFWMLALKPRRQRRDTAMLLSDPWTLTFGPNGF